MKQIFIFFCIVALLLAGCAGLDSLVGFDYDTGVVSPGAPIDTVEGVARGFGPYGEIVAIALGAVGAGYIAFRKIQKKFKK